VADMFAFPQGLSLFSPEMLAVKAFQPLDTDPARLLESIDDAPKNAGTATQFLLWARLAIISQPPKKPGC